MFDPEQAFVNLYGEHRYAFWLDSSKVDERSRFSFMGASGGPLSSVITYDVATRSTEVTRGVTSEVHEESIFDYLSREMKRLRYLSDDLPFDFNCGFVGYFGYELKADVEGLIGGSAGDAMRNFKQAYLFDPVGPCTGRREVLDCSTARRLFRHIEDRRIDDYALSAPARRNLDRCDHYRSGYCRTGGGIQRFLHPHVHLLYDRGELHRRQGILRL